LRDLRRRRSRSGSVHAGRPVLQLSGQTERKRDLTVESTLTTKRSRRFKPSNRRERA
jgi:hypothetical protein